jgi:hypothetical protein
LMLWSQEKVAPHIALDLINSGAKGLFGSNRAVLSCSRLDHKREVTCPNICYAPGNKI